MLRQDSLRPYVSSAEQTRSTDVGAGSRDARQAVRTLRRLLRAAADQQLADPSAALTEVSTLRESLAGPLSSSLVAEDLRLQTSALERQVKELTDTPPGPEMRPAADRCLRRLDGIDDLLREVRRQASLGGTR
jgi:hypothetical protein